MADVADSNAVYYYHFDGMGSVAALSDVNNVIVERYSYDVFGAPTIYDVNSSEISSNLAGQSPALQLFHEFLHLWDLSQNGGIMTLSEMDIISGPEAELAKALGEGVRTSHDWGAIYRTLSPTTTAPAIPEKYAEARKLAMEQQKMEKQKERKK
jgi:hypothetical protein